MKRFRFTLVELLVVIAIIAILAGMLLVGISMAIQKAKKKTAQMDAITLKNAVVMFQTDNQRLPNLDIDTDGDGVPGDPTAKDGSRVLSGAEYQQLIEILRGKSTVDNRRGRNYLPMPRPSVGEAGHMGWWNCKIALNYKNAFSPFAVILDEDEDIAMDGKSYYVPCVVFWEDNAVPGVLGLPFATVVVWDYVRQDGVCSEDIR